MGSVRLKQLSWASTLISGHLDMLYLPTDWDGTYMPELSLCFCFTCMPCKIRIAMFIHLLPPFPGPSATLSQHCENGLELFSCEALGFPDRWEWPLILKVIRVPFSSAYTDQWLIVSLSLLNTFYVVLVQISLVDDNDDSWESSTDHRRDWKFWQSIC